MQYSINIKTLCLNFVSSENENSGLIYISLSVDLYFADSCGFYIILFNSLPSVYPTSIYLGEV